MALLRLSSVAVSISHFDDGRIVEVNSRFVQLFGYDRADVIGRTTLEIGIHLDLAQRQSVYERLRRGESVSEVELDVRTASGRRLRVLASIDVVEADGERWIIGQTHDITRRYTAERCLKENEDRLRAVVDAAPVGIVFQDQAGSIVLWNAAAERILGLTGDDFRERSAMDSRWRAIREDGTPYTAEERPASVTLRTGQHFTGETMGVHRQDGSHVWVSVDTRPLFAEGSSAPTGVVATFVDVTERRGLEQTLRDREARFMLALEAGDLATWDWDVSTGALRTEGFERLAGLPTGSFDGAYETYIQAVHPDDRERVRNSDQDHAGHAGDFSLEYRVVRPDGEVRWLSERGRTIQHRPDGSARLVAGATVDVTERRRMEDALRASEGRFRGAFDHAAIGVALVGLDGRFLDVNRALCELLGYEKRELEGMTFGEVTHPDDLDRGLDLLGRFVAGEVETFQTQKRYLHKDGRIIWGLLNCSLIHDLQGRPHSLISQIVDVTQAREVDRLKSEFVATVSHELRTPLTSVSGYVDLLLDGAVGDLPEPAMGFLTIVQSNARRLVSLINDLLDISRIEAGRLELRRTELDLARAVREIAASFQPQLLAKQQRLRLDLAEETPLVLADPERLTQILANLLSNAHKYTPAGGDVAIVCRPDALGARVEVVDSGIGMSAEGQARLFEKFYRVPNQSGQSEAGTGLGLAITRSLVELHGGSIWFSSAPNEGSTFVFTLPSAGVDRMPVDSGRPAGPSGHPKARLLIVEDEPHVADLLRRLLERGGYEVTLARTAAAALEAVAARRPDLITLDLRLPDADGWDLAAHLRERLGADMPPVLVVSIFPADGQSRDQDLVDHLPKPIQSTELLERVERLLGRRAAQESVRLFAAAAP